MTGDNPRLQMRADTGRNRLRDVANFREFPSPLPSPLPSLSSCWRAGRSLEVLPSIRLHVAMTPMPPLRQRVTYLSPRKTDYLYLRLLARTCSAGLRLKFGTCARLVPVILDLFSLFLRSVLLSFPPLADVAVFPPLSPQKLHGVAKSLNTHITENERLSPITFLQYYAKNVLRYNNENNKLLNSHINSK